MANNWGIAILWKRERERLWGRHISLIHGNGISNVVITGKAQELIPCNNKLIVGRGREQIKFPPGMNNMLIVSKVVYEGEMSICINYIKSVGLHRLFQTKKLVTYFTAISLISTKLVIPLERKKTRLFSWNNWVCGSHIVGRHFISYVVL